jgi:5'-nucleotidase
MTGDMIDALLEQQFQGGNGILQISHSLTYDRSLSAPVGSRISNIRINGIPVDPGTNYRVTMNNFLAEGGDNYTVFRLGTDPLGGAVDLDALVDYFGAHSPVAPGPQNRITLVP